MFKASNGVYVNFRSSGLGSTWYTTDINGVKRTVEEDWETKERRIMYHDSKDSTEEMRVAAVSEYKDHQQREFLVWLETHPEMKQYAQRVKPSLADLSNEVYERMLKTKRKKE